MQTNTNPIQPQNNSISCYIDLKERAKKLTEGVTKGTIDRGEFQDLVDEHVGAVRFANEKKQQVKELASKDRCEILSRMSKWDEMYKKYDKTSGQDSFKTTQPDDWEALESVPGNHHPGEIFRGIQEKKFKENEVMGLLHQHTKFELAVDKDEKRGGTGENCYVDSPPEWQRFRNMVDGKEKINPKTRFIKIGL
jgi:hypothetical protein